MPILLLEKGSGKVVLCQNGLESLESMTTNENCNIHTFLPMSYKTRTETFARRLESKLSLCLDPCEDNGNTDWLPIDTNHYYDLAISPEDTNNCSLFINCNNNNTNGKLEDVYINCAKIELEKKNGGCEYVEELVEMPKCECDGALTSFVDDLLTCTVSTVPWNSSNVDGKYIVSEPLNIARQDTHSDFLQSPDEEEERTPRIRRCSSLKTGKTPPGTPGRKKIVRFADVLGLDLADVRTFMDEIPKIPTSAYIDLCNADTIRPKSKQTLQPLFQQPSSLPNFLDKVRTNNVCLENALVEDQVCIKGVVRVKNLDFSKTVHVRYSLDSWRSFTDMQAVYVENSCDGFSDKFTFLLYNCPLMVGEKVEFAVRFQCKGSQFWDNNGGTNYSFQCLPSTNGADVEHMLNGCDDCSAAFYYMEKKQPINQKVEEVHLTNAAVQNYIANTLKDKSTTKLRKSELLTFFAMSVCAILLYYFKKLVF